MIMMHNYDANLIIVQTTLFIRIMYLAVKHVLFNVLFKWWSFLSGGPI